MCIRDRIPTVLAEDTRSAQERNRAYALRAAAFDAPDPGPDAEDHVRAAYTAATRQANLERLENGTPVSGDLLAILRASGGNLVIARTVSQVADDLLDSVPELVREGALDVKALIMVGAAWIAGQYPVGYMKRAAVTLREHVFQTPEEARLLIEEAWAAWKAPTT